MGGAAASSPPPPGYEPRNMFFQRLKRRLREATLIVQFQPLSCDILSEGSTYQKV